MNLWLSPHGIWYFRKVTLLPCGRRKEFKKTLRTRDKSEAKKKVMDLLACARSAVRTRPDKSKTLASQEQPSHQPASSIVVPIKPAHRRSAQRKPPRPVDTPKLSKLVDKYLKERSLSWAAQAQVAAINDATATYLNTYAARGGKLLVFQGLSDPVFSANDIMAWFDALARDTHGGDERSRDAWVRLFMVPGMTHCGGGTAFNDFDPLGAIEQWVEQGKAPAFLPAKSERFPGQSQPLCVYPAVARYQGGAAGELGSYRCELPTEGSANTQS